jgi:4-amino-4-deoxy-L-arabinose transferase-like glycosyltransferase
MFDIFAIFSYLKKQFSKRDWLIIVGLVALYFVFRLTNLEKWPIFSDEGIYIRWAKVAWQDASWRFISVTDGRQPLQTWGTIPFLKIFSPNDLLAGRMFSVTTGFVALAGMFSLLFYLWGKKAAYIGSLLFIFSPYMLFYDRMALVDSAVNAGFIWILFLSIILVRERRLDIALILGFVGGIALLAKSSSRMFLGLAASAPLLYLVKKDSKFIKNSLNYILLLGIAVAISLLFYNVQRLSPFFHYVELKNTTFVMTFSEFLATPFAYIRHNAYLIPLYVIWESGFLILVPSILGIYFLSKKDKFLALYILIFLVIPWISIGFFAKILFGRYVLFMGSVLIIFAAYYFYNLKGKKLKLLLGGLLFSMTVLNYPLLFDPEKASFPPVDRGQYVEGLTAVWGAQDLMKIVKEYSLDKPTLVLAEGDFGLVADVLKVFEQDDDNIEIKGLWPLTESHLYEHQSQLGEKNVLVVFSHRQEFPENWPIDLISKYGKPNSNQYLFLYRLIPPPIARDNSL